MKHPVLLSMILLMASWQVSAQHPSRISNYPDYQTKAGILFSPVSSGVKTYPVTLPQKRTMFNPRTTAWKWDTILCYTVSSGTSPFQRLTRTYNSLGEVLTNFDERRQSSFTWENYARENYTYDTAGNMTYLSESWQNNSWVNYERREYLYNAAGELADYKRFYWDTTSWNNVWHWVWHFDANGVNDSCWTQVGQDSLWVNQSLWIPNYDGSGNVVSSLSYAWVNNAWEVTSADTSTFDSGGNCLTYLTRQWINGAWVNNSFSTATYDTAGHCLTSLQQLWQNNAWENMGFWSFLYDANGNEIVNLYQLWTNGAWTNSGRQLYNFDAGNNLLSYTSQTPDNSSWRNQDTEQYTYDEWGNSITGKYMHWYNGWQPINGVLAVYANQETDMVLGGEMYRYEALVDSIILKVDPLRSPADVNIFPNPAHSMVYVSSPALSGGQGASVAIYDLRGQIILSKELLNETTGVDVSSLKPGVYFVRFSNREESRVVKFVKN